MTVLVGEVVRRGLDYASLDFDPACVPPHRPAFGRVSEFRIGSQSARTQVMRFGHLDYLIDGHARLDRATHGGHAFLTGRHRMGEIAEVGKEPQPKQGADCVRTAPMWRWSTTPAPGKSTLMRALTGSDVLVENKLFATLDTTVRAPQPESRPRALVSDTVAGLRARFGKA